MNKWVLIIITDQWTQIRSQLVLGLSSRRSSKGSPVPWRWSVGPIFLDRLLAFIFPPVGHQFLVCSFTRRSVSTVISRPISVLWYISRPTFSGRHCDLSSSSAHSWQVLSSLGCHWGFVIGIVCWQKMNIYRNTLLLAQVDQQTSRFKEDTGDILTTFKRITLYCQSWLMFIPNKNSCYLFSV